MIPLLSATILIDEERNASIKFEKLHPDLVINEYVRLALHYYAKVLFIFDPKQPESADAYELLLSAIDNISTANLSNDSNILRLADIDDVVRLSKPEGKSYRLKAKLFSLSAVQRHIETKIPFPKFYLQHLAFSVPILIHGVLQYLDESAIEILKLSFKYMNEQYRSGIDYRQMENIVSIPNSAFSFAIKNFKNKVSENSFDFDVRLLLGCIVDSQLNREHSLNLNNEFSKDELGRFYIWTSFIALYGCTSYLLNHLPLEHAKNISDELRDLFLETYSENANMPIYKWSRMYDIFTKDLKNLIDSNIKIESHIEGIGLLLASASSFGKEYFGKEFINDCGKIGVEIWESVQFNTKNKLISLGIKQEN